LSAVFLISACALSVPAARGTRATPATQITLAGSNDNRTDKVSAVPQTSDAEEAIRRVIAATAAANNAGDVDAWVALFAPDFVYMAPGAPAVSTRDALVAVARAGFIHTASIRIEPVEIQLMGDWAFARTAVSGSVVIRGSGNTVTVDNKQLVVYRRQPDGQWKIARLITNNNR
jgi:uncharacterized protein (TIGR02246 family)